MNTGTVIHQHLCDVTLYVKMNHLSQDESYESYRIFKIIRHNNLKCCYAHHEHIGTYDQKKTPSISWLDMLRVPNQNYY